MTPVELPNFLRANREAATRMRAAVSLDRPFEIERATIHVPNRQGDQRFGKTIPISVARVRAMEASDV